MHLRGSTFSRDGAPTTAGKLCRGYTARYSVLNKTVAAYAHNAGGLEELTRAINLCLAPKAQSQCQPGATPQESKKSHHKR